MSGSKVDIGVGLLNEAHAETARVRAELERVRKINAELVKRLTVIAECAEENYRDWVKDGYETTEPIEYARVTAENSRAAIACAFQDDTQSTPTEKDQP